MSVAPAAGPEGRIQPDRDFIHGGTGGCPNVGGLCIGCTMPGFPDQFMPFGDTPRAGRLPAETARFTYGPLIKRLRKRAIRRKYERV